MSKNAQVRSKLLEIARILWLVSARTQICVLTVCQQQHWQVFEHCSNSRIKASVGTKSVPTLDMSVQTFEQDPWAPQVGWQVRRRVRLQAAILHSRLCHPLGAYTRHRQRRAGLGPFALPVARVTRA